jgi:DNA-directed RNA polymerase specialized sigma24 family protein
VDKPLTAGFNDHFARSRLLLHYIACRVVADSERAELAVRNCWRRACSNPPRFGHEGAFRSWLVRLLIDEALAILHGSKHGSALCWLRFNP